MPKEHLRDIGLRVFLFGATSFVAFSMLVPGAELWKRILTIGFWSVGLCGFAIYAYAVLQLWRGK